MLDGHIFISISDGWVVLSDVVRGVYMYWVSYIASVDDGTVRNPFNFENLPNPKISLPLVTLVLTRFSKKIGTRARNVGMCPA